MNAAWGCAPNQELQGLHSCLLLQPQACAHLWLGEGWEGVDDSDIRCVATFGRDDKHAWGVGGAVGEAVGAMMGGYSAGMGGY